MNTFTSTVTNSQHASRLHHDRLATVVTLLKYTYGLVPVIAGLDKFAHLLTDWNKYLSPVVADILPFSAATFLGIVGVIEIIAGVLVFVKPKIGALAVSLWLAGIVLNLLLTGQYFDIAVRDLVMAIGAFSLYLMLPYRGEAQ
ncbi:tRNA (5-methylaminomethyl-2-thiouridylate)-methyltransferase [Pontibacter sp. BT731]|uniref:tRNA (5-methylaminomethyl-2-thiouridylate)-methyltransferase n=1 Tax=Pontibacter coccineus TaxID=3063328 RepID=UPI0026E39581|nr:tRNA (5-methylaminomethyl-2-thiouridylate)-methyltransferase [Pontibacter sp. BT731]MDO6388519.1 tRNA (5-methylaminomethyl-2-thiouridylate)-methyltransferase [Pontibacter sp. BT731]